MFLFGGARARPQAATDAAISDTVTSRTAGMRLIATRAEKRHSCAAVELPHRDAELFGLVGEVGGDAGARKHDDPDRHHGQHLVIAPERSSLGVARPA